MFFLENEGPDHTFYNTIGETVVLNISVITFLDRKMKHFELNGSKHSLNLICLLISS
jgi:hypothetical protein